jgi:aspartokinase/homoserine dehydrogenase 1
VELKDAPNGRASAAVDAVDFMATHALHRPVLVDVASGDTSRALASALAHGMDLVLANKVPLASAMSASREILHDARSRGRRILHEATVGAGLPVIDTLQQLAASGDRVDSVDSSPSGTMGFLFSEMGRGRKFSEIVRDAMTRGYTEPDPRDDLSGRDVARKGLILARMLGYAGEMEDVILESLVPDSLRDVTPAEFLELLPTGDAEWEQRVASARARAARCCATGRAPRVAACVWGSPACRWAARSRRSTARTTSSSSRPRDIESVRWWYLVRARASPSRRPACWGTCSV